MLEESEQPFEDEGARQRIRLRAALVKESGSGSDYLRRIPVRHQDTLVLIPTSQVATIVANGETLTISTLDRQQHSFVYRLKDLEARLDPTEFIRLNRGALVNVNVVSRIVPGSAGTSRVVFVNGGELRMSRMQSKRFRRILLELLR